MKRNLRERRPAPILKSRRRTNEDAEVNMNGIYGTFSDHSRKAELKPISSVDYRMSEAAQGTTQHLRKRFVSSFGKDIFFYNSGNTLLTDDINEKGQVSIVETVKNIHKTARHDRCATLLFVSDMVIEVCSGDGLGRLERWELGGLVFTIASFDNDTIGTKGPNRKGMVSRMTDIMGYKIRLGQMYMKEMTYL